MGFRKQLGRLVVALLPLLALSCADGGPTAADAFYNLTCPAPATQVECGAFAESTCLRPEGGSMGEREIVGANGDASCDEEDRIVAICEATQRSDGAFILTLEASAGDGFAFELRGAVIDANGTITDGSCEITIMESGSPYGGILGRCGAEAPSMEQPCQISNVTLGDGDISFDVQCNALRSEFTLQGFDVNGTIEFARCTGLP